MNRYLLTFFLLAVVPIGATTLYSNVADTQVYSGGIFSYNVGDSLGEIGVNGGYDYSDVFVFQLPTLNPGQNIASADFGFYLWNVLSSYNVDLYGLAYRASATVLASDWYSGPNDANNTLLEANILTPASVASNLVYASTAGDAALLAYLKAQYAAGAVGGDFVFLRLSSDVTNGANTSIYNVVNQDYAVISDQYYPGTLATFENIYSPRIDLNIVSPEPGTTLEVMLGLALLLCSRRFISRFAGASLQSVNPGAKHERVDRL